MLGKGGGISHRHFLPSRDISFALVSPLGSGRRSTCLREAIPNSAKFLKKKYLFVNSFKIIRNNIGLWVGTWSVELQVTLYAMSTLRQNIL